MNIVGSNGTGTTHFYTWQGDIETQLVNPNSGFISASNDEGNVDILTVGSAQFGRLYVDDGDNSLDNFMRIESTSGDLVFNDEVFAKGSMNIISARDIITTGLSSGVGLSTDLGSGFDELNLTAVGSIHDGAGGGALLSQSGQVVNATTTGTGDIRLAGENVLSLKNITTADGEFHATALQTLDTAAGSTLSLVDGGSLTAPTVNVENITSAGNLLLDATNDITVATGGIQGTDAASVTLRSTGGITIVGDVNTLNGDVNVLAGWDGTTNANSPFDVTPFKAENPTHTLFGNGAGSLIVADGSQTQDVSIGSRFGDTNVFAHDLTINGGSAVDAAAQLGFRFLNDSVTNANGHTVEGDIDVFTNGAVSLVGGSNDSRYATIGHGDMLSDDDSTESVVGDIRVRVGEGANLSRGTIGHMVDPTGTYASGDTGVAVGWTNFRPSNTTDQLVASTDSQFVSAAYGDGGELRFYLPQRSAFAPAAGTLVNGVAASTFTSSDPFPNTVGHELPFTGTYAGTLGQNWSFYITEQLSISLSAVNGTSHYGDTPVDPGLAMSAGSLHLGDTVGSIGITTDFAVTNVTPAGAYVISANSSGLNTTDYNLTGLIDGTFTVLQTPLTITPDDQTKGYSTPFTFNNTEFSITGLKNGETIGPLTLSSTGAPASANVGNHVINASTPTGGTFDVNNYSVVSNQGTFFVQPAALTIRANDQTKAYGDTFVFNGTEFTSTGLLNGETIDSVNLQSAGADANAVGIHSIDASAPVGTVFDALNYSITFLPGELTIPIPDSVEEIDNGSVGNGRQAQTEQMSDSLDILLGGNIGSIQNSTSTGVSVFSGFGTTSVDSTIGSSTASGSASVVEPPEQPSTQTLPTTDSNTESDRENESEEVQ